MCGGVPLDTGPSRRASCGGSGQGWPGEGGGILTPSLDVAPPTRARRSSARPRVRLDISGEKLRVWAAGGDWRSARGGVGGPDRLEVTRRGPALSQGRETGAW